MPHCKPPNPPPLEPPQEPPQLIFKEEAVQRITELVTNLVSEEENQLDSDTGEALPATLTYILTKRQKRFEFFVTKLVEDILAYCHRRDFPEPLLYTAVEMILKQFTDELTAAANGLDVNAPISKIKMGDTEYDFAVANVDLSGVASERLFNSIKSKLSLFRRPLYL